MNNLNIFTYHIIKYLYLLIKVIVYTFLILIFL